MTELIGVVLAEVCGKVWDVQRRLLLAHPEPQSEMEQQQEGRSQERAAAR